MRRRTRIARCLLEAIEPRRLLTAIVYVDANSPSLTPDGLSWATAYPDLQLALTAAQAGDEIHVADGTYKPTAGLDRAATFQLKNGVGVLGGYAGYGATPNPDARDVAGFPTILSGDIGAPNDTSDNSYHVVTGSGNDTTAVLDGFTIPDGNAVGSTLDKSAGGLLAVVGSPTLRNCILRDNAAVSGGGLCCTIGSPILTDCSFIHNTATEDGGGMACGGSSPTLTNCMFDSNSASGFLGRGGGLMNKNSSSPALINCTFISNSSVEFGGGMVNFSSSSPTIKGCIFARNSSVSDGGAIYNTISSSPSIEDCTFTGNKGNGGGAVSASSSCSPKMTDCVFVGNTAIEGGAVEIVGGSVQESRAVLVNCTLVANTGSLRGGAVAQSGAFAFVTISNCVIWANSSPDSPAIYDPNGSATVSQSDVQGGWPGTGNIDADPQFTRNPSPGADSVWGTADDDYGDLRLQSTSPCIDAGDNSALPADLTTDLAGQPRFSDVLGVRDPGAIVDMGAYETAGSWGVVRASYQFNAPRPGVRIVFSDPADASSFNPGDITLMNLTTGLPIDCTALATASYDAGTNSGSWTFNSTLLPDGNYHATITGGSVSSALGAPLPADNGFDFYVLGGDANRDRIVDVKDFSTLTANWHGTAKVFSQGDFNYDGKVDDIDLGILASRWQSTLAQPAPALPARTSVVPRRTATRVISQIL